LSHNLIGRVAVCRNNVAIANLSHLSGGSLWVDSVIVIKILCSIEMGPDPTQAYFWPAVNKRPTQLWPWYFLTRPKDIFIDPKGKKLKNLGFIGEIFQTQTPNQKRWPDPTQATKYWPDPTLVKNFDPNPWLVILG